MSPTPDSSVRRTISHYEILAPLGKGGMGEVYIAFDTTLHRKVALKAVRQDRQLEDEGRARLLREARMLSQLDHANICRVFDYVSDGFNDYLVMELIEGRSLREAMKESLPRAARVRIAEEVVRALAVAHAAGIVHRDLKPENVMLLPDGSAKVLDFGLARPFDAPLPVGPRHVSSPLPHDIGAQFDSAGETVAATAPSGPFTAGSPVNTAHGVLVGTPAYMSPEQAAGQPATAPSDMYAFGLLLQELHTGVSAYDLTSDLPTLLERVRRGETRKAHGLGRDLADLLTRLQSVAPSRRPTAVETVERLRRIREKPARRLRYAAAAALLIAAVAGTVKYTLDLGHERNAAVLAREDADRRRDQAETLIGFMLGDLRGRLQRVGRLDVLDAVGGRAMEYFAAVPSSALTDEELFRRSQAVHQLGEVRMTRGDLAGAATIFEQSLALIADLTARRPDNAEWQVGLATSHFYVGDARRLQGDLEAAMRHFTAYREVARGLVARDHTRSEWRMELGYGYSNVAAILEAQGDLEGARKELLAALEIDRGLVAEKPSEVEWQESLATSHNRLAVVLEKLGDAKTALTHHLDDFAIRKTLVARDPEDTRAQLRLATAASYVGLLYRDFADDSRAAEYSSQRLVLAERLAARDPENVEWQRELGIAEVRMATLQRLGGNVKAAVARARRAVGILRPLAAKDLSHLRRQRDAADAEVEWASVQLIAGDRAGALSTAASATATLEQLLPRNPADIEIGRLLAEALIISAHAAREADARARPFLERARAVLEPRATTVRERRFRKAWAMVLRGLGRSQEAEVVAAELRASGFRPFAP